MLSNQFWLVYLQCLFAWYIVIVLHQEQDDGGAGGGVGGAEEYSPGVSWTSLLTRINQPVLNSSICNVEKRREKKSSTMHS